ncbi:MAG: hypothetical protein AB1806_01260 [Acidobacteriota bacterium]
MQKKWLVFGLAAAVAVAAVACGGETTTPVSPSAATAGSSALGPDNSTLKVTAPTLQSPADGVELAELAATLVLSAATGVYVNAETLSYRFILQNATTGAQIIDSGLITSGGAQTSYAIPADTLEAGGSYRWRARAERDGAFGPWSSFRTFTTPTPPENTAGYITGSEIWDPLVDGKTVGTASGVAFIPDKGVQMLGLESVITYTLPTTLTSGAVEFNVENLDPDSDGGKTKVFSMQEGYGDITANRYRFNLEKRGDDHADVGKFRLRIITGNAEEGAFSDSPRLAPTGFSISKTYYIRVSWGNGVVRFLMRENDPAGFVAMDYSFTYSGTYRPSPHVVHIGAPVPRGGAADATVPKMIVRYFYVSPGTGQWPGWPKALPFFGFDLDGPGQ